MPVSIIKAVHPKAPALPPSVTSASWWTSPWLICAFLGALAFFFGYKWLRSIQGNRLAFVDRIQRLKLTRAVILLLLASSLLLGAEQMAAGFLATACRETGFAILVSAIIWMMFEGQLRQEAEAIWDQRIEHATRNVFQAVLRKDLPKPLLDEANNLILNSSLIRLGFTATYTIRDIEAAEASCPADSVLVDAVMEFSMKNVSTDVVVWRSGLKLPNPIHPEMKALVRVHRFEVKKGAEPVMLELAEAETKFRSAIIDDTLTAVSFDAGGVTLQPGEICTCSTNYTMAKEAEDSEVLQTLHPADGLRVTVFDQATDSRRVIFAQSVHRMDIERETVRTDVPSAQIFRIPGYLLPHQGVLIWWKRRPAPSRPPQAGSLQVVDDAGSTRG